MNNSSIKLKDETSGPIGYWRLDVYKGDIIKDSLGNITNELVEVIEGTNLIVTVGKQMIMDRLYGLSAVGPITRTGVGTSATAAALANTSLTNGAFKAFDALPTRSGTVVTSVTTFNTGDANINWQELGLDNGATLLNRIAPIGPFNKTAAVSIVVTVTVTQN